MNDDQAIVFNGKWLIPCYTYYKSQANGGPLAFSFKLHKEQFTGAYLSVHSDPGKLKKVDLVSYLVYIDLFARIRIIALETTTSVPNVHNSGGGRNLFLPESTSKTAIYALHVF